MIATPLAFGAAPLLHTVPVAQADTSCTWNWGIKQSFRSYIKGKIARGGWGASGIGFTGNETGNGAFVFKASSPQASGDTVTVPFQGTLNFKGHDGVLDMTMSDFKVTASGNQAKISVDYVSYELNRSNYSRGQRIQGDDEVIATIRLQEPVKSGAKKVNLAGSTSLTSGGVKLFTGFYNQGEALDPSSGTIALDGSCAGGGSAGGGSGSQRQLNSISGNFTGFNKEAMDILSETNDTMNGITTFMGNTQAFLDELESFRNRGNSNSGTGNSNSGVHRPVTSPPTPAPPIPAQTPAPREPAAPAQGSPPLGARASGPPARAVRPPGVRPAAATHPARPPVSPKLPRSGA